MQDGLIFRRAWVEVDLDALEDPNTQDFFSLSPDGFRFVFDLNVTAAFLTTQVFAKDMAKNYSLLSFESGVMPSQISFNKASTDS